MRNGKTALLAGAIVLAVPAVVIAGDPGNVDPLQAPVEFAEQTVWTAGSVQTDSKGYKPVGDMPAPEEIPADWTRPTTLQVSVDMTSGKARMRLTDTNDVNPPEFEPRSVLFAGKGVSTATFVIRTGDLDGPVLEWKRVGKSEARAASVVVAAIAHPD